MTNEENKKELMEWITQDATKSHFVNIIREVLELIADIEEFYPNKKPHVNEVDDYDLDVESYLSSGAYVITDLMAIFLKIQEDNIDLLNRWKDTLEYQIYNSIVNRLKDYDKKCQI